MSKNLTSGTPWKSILIFAIPLLVGNVVQQLYQVIDAIVVGQHLGVNALAAIGTTGAMLFLLIGFAWGVTTGFAIPTAQAFGAQDLRAVRRSVAAGTVLTGVVALLITLVGVFFAHDLLTLLQTPAELVEDATRFATVSFAGAGATMYFNYLSAIIRAKGDSRTPLVFLMISCVVNVGLVILFVQYLGLDVGGAAAATVAAQLLSVVLCLVYVRRAIPEFALSREDFIESRKAFGRHLRIGLPMGFQSSIVAIGSLAVQVRLNTLGAQAVAAYTTATRVDGLSVAFMASLGLAVSTFVAQNYGAQQIRRILTGVRQGTFMAVGMAVLLGVVFILFGENIVRLFVGAGSKQVVSMAHEFLVCNGICYFILGILFTTRSALQGLGRVAIPMLSGILELVMRVSAAIVLAGLMGFDGIIWANPLAWLGAAALLLPAWMVARKHLAKTAASLQERREAIDGSYPASQRAAA